MAVTVIRLIFGGY